jgi:acetyl esterase/lipase
LYLPTAPHAAETFGVHDEQIIAALSASSNGTIVQVNYRAGDGVRYPTPVHDVLAGYDYVKERFRAHSWTTGSGRVQKASLHVGVCGQLVGGSLAAMLGLTESHLTQDRIAAVAINSPIADWIFPERQQTIDDVFKQVTTNQQDENERKPRTRRKKSAPSSTWEAYGDSSPASTRSLETLRRSLFKMPANYFDPFASPVHLFRSPTANVPSDLKDGDDTAELLMAQAKPRKAHRTFPPSNSTLVLPHIRLSTGAHNPLADSNEEFVKLLRRSVVRTALSRSNTQALLDSFEEEPTEEDDRLEEAISEAERRVEYHIGEGSGLWGTERKEQWVVDVENVGRWFRSIER